MTTTEPPVFDEPPSGPAQRGPDRVPIDQRVGGIDKNTIWPGVVLLVVWAIWGHFMPFLNNRVELDNPVKDGDVINLGAGEITFIPTVGWNLESGLRLTEDSKDKVNVPASALLSGEGISYDVKSGNWEGTPDELLDRMIEVNDKLDTLVATDERARADITNADGVPGRLVYIFGGDEAVLIATLVFDVEGPGPDIGIEIEARGDAADIRDQAASLARMIDSTTYRPTEGSN